MPQRIVSLQSFELVLPEIILVLWAIAGLVVHGDIKYDWINAENATKGVEG